MSCKIKEAHDRFMIIDDTELYHIGTSLKDLGKKWFQENFFTKAKTAFASFAFSRMVMGNLEMLGGWGDGISR